MARNRKRAKERRARRPQPVASRGRHTSAHGGLPESLEHAGEAPEALEPEGPERLESEVPAPVEGSAPEPLEDSDPEPLEYEPPAPLEHAAPDAEVAEAQLELSRFEQLEDEQAPVEEEPEPPQRGWRAGRRAGRTGGGFDGEGGRPPGGGGLPDGGGELAIPAGVAAERRAVSGNRLITFLQGSWRELQRVQWPDRRQVMQATGVVIGFVIVAGVFLGVSDWVAGKVVGFIINGHF